MGLFGNQIEDRRKDIEKYQQKIADCEKEIADLVEIYLVSDLEPAFVEKIFLKPAKSAQAALDKAFERLGPDATVLAMPYGGSTLPKVAE